MTEPDFNKTDFETLSNFRYQLRRFVHWSEDLTQRAGITNLQYLLLLHVKGFPGRDWATIGELAERLQAKHHGTVALVTRCEKLGLVERRSSRSDGRAVEVHLTRQGEKLVKLLARQHRDELMRLEGIFAVPGRRQLQPGD
ncbi:helix-turn-helix domain-containing protein [Rhodocyclaceae bacterium]